MQRRRLLSRLAALPIFGTLAAAGAAAGAAGAAAPPPSADAKRSLRIMMKSAWGSDDPTKAVFPFSHGLALAEAGHEVQIFLLGEAVTLMRQAVAHAVVPMGWPPLAEFLEKVVAKKIRIYACGACSRARGVTEADLQPWNAQFGSPAIFVSMVEWADRVITE